MKYSSFFLFAMLPIIVFCTVSRPKPTSAAVVDWEKGVSIGPLWNGDFDSDRFRQTIDGLAHTGVNMVTLVIPYYQSNIYSTDAGPGWNTPTDESLIAGINYIHERGLRVNLKPHLDSYDGQWRALINPSDRDGWFWSYGNILSHLATVARDHRVEKMTIGTELISMSDPAFSNTNTERWRSLIGQVRAVYSGNLTYSANWGGPGWTDEKNHIVFWDALDAIGISAYFPLNAGDNSPESLRREWHRWNTQDIMPLQQRWNKPIEFSEVGYRSVAGARFQPFDFWSGNTVDHTEQANLYEALFSYWNDYGFMRGMQLWNWESQPDTSGNNTSYTPQYKSAFDVMTRWFARGQTPNQPHSFTATANAPAGEVNQPVTVNATVTNTDGPLTAGIVDIEIYGSNGERVFQQFFNDQSFASAQSRTYSVSWAPTAAGQYNISVGVFNNNWTLNYLWNGNAGSATVGLGSNNPPPQDTRIDIWWPTQGSSVSGVQPIKALVRNVDVNAYAMSWQVDGDRFNAMETNMADYPHKETLIDVSEWRWHGSGPYKLRLLAQDFGGRQIAETQIDLYVY